MSQRMEEGEQPLRRYAPHPGNFNVFLHLPLLTPFPLNQPTTPNPHRNTDQQTMSRTRGWGNIRVFNTLPIPHNIHKILNPCSSGFNARIACCCLPPPNCGRNTNCDIVETVQNNKYLVPHSAQRSAYNSN
jgi:hypothetical protein